jgi:hypothetical protein
MWSLNNEHILPGEIYDGVHSLRGLGYTRFRLLFTRILPFVCGYFFILSSEWFLRFLIFI